MPEHVPEAIRYWLERYSRNPLEAARNLRELAAKAPDRTVETILPLYQEGRCGDAASLVAGLLGRNSRTVASLCDPAISVENAIRVAQELVRKEPRFDAHFAKSLLVDDLLTEPAMQKGLTILEHFNSGGRLVPIVIQFLRNPDSRIRSRAALMLGRTQPTPRLMQRLMRDEDARVRANFVEGLWSSSAEHRAFFRLALQDSSPRVVGNALIGLHRAGEMRDVVLHLARLGRHADPALRATAAWVMGQTGEDRFVPVLQHMLQDLDPRVQRPAQHSLERIKKQCSRSEL